MRHENVILLENVSSLRTMTSTWSRNFLRMTPEMHENATIDQPIYMLLHVWILLVGLKYIHAARVGTTKN